ncbi:MAG: hypothetical protein PWP27_1813 [Clostridiales bacterium]|jgi:HSP20 family protein|nr:hypothetical protein [Clostridiales bacterium]MDK2934003.1 hypothetical protein [Clostridiales bacterium]
MFGLTPFNRKKNSLINRPQSIFDFDNLFDSFFADSLLPSFFNSNQIKVDIKENENEYIVEAELPGIKKKEINLEINDDVLTISVVRNEEITTEKENYIRKERSFGSMSRSFAISNIINEKVSANFSDGILTVILPKKKTGMPKNRRIDID